MPLVPVQISECECPFCHNEDRVRGFKVGDKWGWWSECRGDHAPFNNQLPDHEQFRVGQTCWFIWESDDTFLIESPTSGKVARVMLELITE